jgi:hypothetical protein
VHDNKPEPKYTAISPLDALACHLLTVSQLSACPFEAAPYRLFIFLQKPLNFMPGHTLCPGHQCLRLSGSSSLSLTSRFDASNTLSYGCYSACGWWCPPLFVQTNVYAFDFSSVYVLGYASRSKRVWSFIEPRYIQYLSHSHAVVLSSGTSNMCVSFSYTTTFLSGIPVTLRCPYAYCMPIDSLIRGQCRTELPCLLALTNANAGADADCFHYDKN